MNRHRPTISAWGAALLATVALALPAGLAAQQATLSLEEAIRIARQNNPTYLSVVNDAGPADWAERQAYAGVLPTAGASMSAGYQAPGTPNFGVFTASDIGIGKTPAYYSSSYGLSLGLTLSPGTFFEMKRARRARQATHANIGAQAFELASTVTVAYLAALRGEDAVALAERQLEQAQETLELARARVEVGEAIPLDGKQAQVGLGRAQVALLQAQNLRESQQRRLAQQLGVRLPDSVELTSEFDMFEPPWVLEELVAEALPNHPQLRSLRASASAARANLRSAQGSYLPSLRLSAGWSGFALEVG
ncbi:MAG TPA: TolC family protein, partial [Longimicrobiales bacterium]|nr:TolC family protein [Longimicrobiales bacterium]